MSRPIYLYQRSRTSQLTGNREQVTGNRQQATGNRQQVTGDRGQGTGNREPGTENREQGTAIYFFPFSDKCSPFPDQQPNNPYPKNPYPATNKRQQRSNYPCLFCVCEERNLCPLKTYPNNHLDQNPPLK